MRFVFCLSCLLLLIGCEKQQREHELLPRVDHTPLELDPTDKVELARWWSNGNRMLQLDDSAHYALYGDVNRYHEPIQTGRWNRESYAAMWLEPYNTSSAQRIRVGIARSNSRLTLTLPDLEPMTAIERPDVVLEDQLIGTWQGEPGSLRLDPDMRYTLTAADPNTSTRVSEKGGWQIVDDRLVLTPDAAAASRGLQPTALVIHADDKSVLLVSDHGALTQHEKFTWSR